MYSGSEVVISYDIHAPCVNFRFEFMHHAMNRKCLASHPRKIHITLLLFYFISAWEGVGAARSGRSVRSHHRRQVRPADG